MMIGKSGPREHYNIALILLLVASAHLTSLSVPILIMYHLGIEYLIFTTMDNNMN